mgnify:CR=1 FL=1
MFSNSLLKIELFKVLLTRKRPAMVLAKLQGDDIILCEITSRIRNDPYVISLNNTDLESGKLKVRSIVRPNRLLTINKNKINYKFGKVKERKLQEVMIKLKEIFKI